jgi:hypothetical protein
LFRTWVPTRSDLLLSRLSDENNRKSSRDTPYMYLGLCKNRFIRNGNDLAIRCRRWALMFHKNTLPAVSRFPQNILTERRKYLYVRPNHNETSSNIQEKYNNTRSAGDVYFGLHQAFKNTIRQDENTLLLRHVCTFFIFQLCSSPVLLDRPQIAILADRRHLLNATNEMNLSAEISLDSLGGNNFFHDSRLIKLTGFLTRCQRPCNTSRFDFLPFFLL